jgi:hypothetical protein
MAGEAENNHKVRQRVEGRGHFEPDHCRQESSRRPMSKNGNELFSLETSVADYLRHQDTTTAIPYPFSYLAQQSVAKPAMAAAPTVFK